MKVLIVNTSEKAGGAAVAASRLTAALINNGVKAQMLVRDKQTDSLHVSALPRQWLQRWRFLWERWLLFCHLHLRRKHLFDIDTATAGADITRLPEFREADIIHLHWVNQGMLSLGDLRRIVDSGKPVVWTMHDIWPATALCHLTLSCQHFKTECRRCRLLPGGGSNTDLAHRVWRRKQRVMAHSNIIMVACSRWLEGEARQSKLLEGLHITSVPNPIDTRLFHPLDQGEARRLLGLPADRRLLLFVSQRATNVYKGIGYLIEACRLLAGQQPDAAKQTAVAIMGSHADELAGQLPFDTYPLGYVSDEHQIAAIYSAADAFVLPSLSENLPNTIMEAMACGVPSVGFKVGGIPEEIDHRRNGYVARYRDAADLAEGIRWTLFEADREELRRQCLHKVAACYSPHSVAMRYIEVYNQALALKHYQL